MSSDKASNTPLEDLGRKLDARLGGAVVSAEEELRRVIAYLNDEVVPQVQKNSSEALRAAAAKLASLADILERRSRGN